MRQSNLTAWVRRHNRQTKVGSLHRLLTHRDPAQPRHDVAWFRFAPTAPTYEPFGLLLCDCVAVQDLPQRNTDVQCEAWRNVRYRRLRIMSVDEGRCVPLMVDRPNIGFEQAKVLTMLLQLRDLQFVGARTSRDIGLDDLATYLGAPTPDTILPLMAGLAAQGWLVMRPMKSLLRVVPELKLRELAGYTPAST